MTSKTSKTSGKGVPKGEKPSQNAFFRLLSTTYFLTYKGISENGQKITKKNLANFLLNNPKENKKIKLEKYLICQQMYDSGEPHFHAVLIYSKRKEIRIPDYFDYLGIHPNIQTMRNMKAALDYVYKEDPSPLTNMDIAQQKRVARAKDSSSLYQLLQQQMLKDPFKFDVDDYCTKYKIFKQIYKANYNKAITLIKRAQPAAARAILQNKPGIKFIDEALISQRLKPSEIEQFYSHPSFQKIVNHINQIYTYPNRNQDTMAPSKTPHLLIVGDASIGKSALVDHRANQTYPYPGLAHYYACYHLSIGQKYFPPYRSFDYRLVRWNEFTIISDMFPKSGYNRLLDYLEGAPSALPQKGRAPVQRQDNPKHILTSNRTLDQHINKTFRSKESRALARRNIGTRIDCVVIPEGKNIHFLRKLFVAPEIEKDSFNKEPPVCHIYNELNKEKEKAKAKRKEDRDSFKYYFNK